MSSVLSDIYTRHKIVNKCLQKFKKENSLNFDDDWITVKGTHVLIDDEGVAQSGGKLKGMNFSKSVSQKKVNSSKASSSPKVTVITDSSEKKKIIKTAPIGTKFSTTYYGQKVSYTKVADSGDYMFQNDYTGSKTGPISTWAKFMNNDMHVITPNNEASTGFSKKSNASILSEERREATPFISDNNEADDNYRNRSGKIWRSLDSASREALYSYTNESYLDINSRLRDGNASEAPDYIKGDIYLITDAISKSKLEKDAWFVRGVSAEAVGGMFGIPTEITPENVKNLVGLTGQDEGFMSCGSVVGSGLKDNVSLRVFAPAGTEALYAEPFSAYGNGSGLEWDGKSKQTSYSGEMETILQRGSCFQCVKAESTSDGKIQIELVITSQHYEN